MTNHFSFIVDKPHSRIDQYLADKLPDISRSKIQSFIKLGRVTINGKRVKSSLILHGEETIKCNFINNEKDRSIVGENMKLEILHEDDSLVVINKPAGIVVHPGNGNRSGTLLNGLVYQFQQLSYKNSPRPGIIHRLDKYTSGVILIAKNDKIHNFLSNQFKLRKVKKEYLALVWGKLDKNGIINGRIGRNPRNRQLFTMVNNGGRDSYTQYKLDKYLPPLSLVKLYPKTGRTHQLRVHLQFIGHPIFCDDDYGGGKKHSRSFHVKYMKTLDRLIKITNRVALHAHIVKIYHPETMKKMEFRAPLPPDLKNILKILNNE